MELRIHRLIVRTNGLEWNVVVRGEKNLIITVHCLLTSFHISDPIIFDDGASTFLDFLETAESLLGAIFAEIEKFIKDTDEDNPFDQGIFDKENSLFSKASLMDIMRYVDNLRNAKTTQKRRGDLNVLMSAKKELIDFLSGHEIHVLFSILRMTNVSASEYWLFNPATMTYESWIEHAEGNTLFAAVLMATWLRCIVGRDDCFASASTLKTAILDTKGDHLLPLFAGYFKSHYDKAFGRHLKDVDSKDNFKSMVYLLSFMGYDNGIKSNAIMGDIQNANGEEEPCLARIKPRCVTEAKGVVECVQCVMCTGEITTLQTKVTCSKCQRPMHKACTSTRICSTCSSA